MVLTETLSENMDAIKSVCAPSTDVVYREFTVSGTKAAVAFLEGVVDSEAQRDLMDALSAARIPEVNADSLTADVIPVFGVSRTDNTQGCVEAVFRGDTVLLVEGSGEALIINTAKWEKRAITEPPTSTVLQGPREGFTEDLRTNLTQIRRRLQTPNLTFKHLYVGRLSHTDVAVIYLKGVADRKLVRQIVDRIEAIDYDGILDVNYLVEALEKYHSSLFPQTGTLEKPDVLVSKIMEGRIAVMVNGSPIAITLPFLLYENFQQAEDYYTRRKAATFLRFLRVFGAFLGIFLPGLYVAVQIYHYTVIPLSYLYTIMNAVQGLPMMPLMEMIFVLLVFEILHEASFRMPKYVGMAMSVVGALVLGDTAVKAGLISSPSIMIVALSTISLYAIPVMVNSFKILRLVFTVIGGVAGIWGMALFGLAVLVYLASIDSYGTPYLAPFAPLVKNDLQDAFTRTNLGKMKRRPMSFGQINPYRRDKGGTI